MISRAIDFLLGVEPYESAMRAASSSAGDATIMVVTIEPLHDLEQRFG